MIKAIIFDCFGVFYVDSQNSLRDRFPDKIAELEDLRRQSYYGLVNKEEYLQATSQLTGLSVVEIENIVTSEHVMNKPLLEFIKNDLRQNYKIGILSNVGRGWLAALFKEPQKEGLFDVIIASGEEGIAKPDPSIFRLAAERLGVRAEECIMIDDMEQNCAGARSAGMQAIHYESLEDIKEQLRKALASD